MRKLVRSAWALGASLALATPALAEDERKPNAPFGGMVTGSVTLANEYSFRGVSQTKRDPALQAAITYEVPLAGTGVSLYAGVWGSNINFVGDLNESLEVDGIAGFRGRLFDDKMSWDLGWIGYFYPGSDRSARLTYHEMGLTLGYDFDIFAVTAGINYSPQFTLRSGHAVYILGAVTVPLTVLKTDTFEWKLFGSIAHQLVQKNSRFGLPDYMDYRIGLVVSAWQFDLGAYLIGTDIEKSKCGGKTYCSPRALITLTRNF